MEVLKWEVIDNDDDYHRNNTNDISNNNNNIKFIDYNNSETKVFTLWTQKVN